MSDILVNALCHHGIEGQKWGVRRYQNSDGSLTDEGRKRYGIKATKKNIRLLEERYAYSKSNRDTAKAELDVITGKGTEYETPPDKLSDDLKKKYEKQYAFYKETLDSLARNESNYINAVDEARRDFGDKKIKDIKRDDVGDIEAYIRGERALEIGGVVFAIGGPTLLSIPVGLAIAAIPSIKYSNNYNKTKKEFEQMN